VHEGVLSGETALHVMDHERASEVIRTARPMGVGLCYLPAQDVPPRSRLRPIPLEICMTFNTAAASLIKHGYARPVDAAEGLDLLQQARERHLVQFGENVQRGVSFICNCCGCCCEAMIRGAPLRPDAPGPHHGIPAGRRWTATAPAAASA